MSTAAEIAAIVEMERASEEAERANAQTPTADDDDEPDELALEVEQNIEQFEAVVTLFRRLHNKEPAK